ncbi:MAG: hypothetical protein ABW187_02210 [Dokdonella sp.]
MSERVGNSLRYVCWLAPLATALAGYVAGRAQHASWHVVDHGKASSVATSQQRLAARSDIRRSDPAPVRGLPTTPAALPNVPPTDAPLQQAFDVLAERARAGDASASMRLLRELGRCENRAQTGEFASQPDDPTGPPQAGEDPWLAWLRTTFARGRAAARIEYAATADLCSGVTHAQIATLGECLQRSAASGDAESELCYALVAASSTYAPDRYSDEWIKWMQRYRLQARAYAEDAFSAGLAHAAPVLYAVYAGPYADTPPVMIEDGVAPDLERAYALALFIAQHLEAHPSDVQPPGAAGDWLARAHVLERQLSAAAAIRAQRWATAQDERFAASAPLEHRCGAIEDTL